MAGRTPSISVRAGEPADVPLIASLIRALAAYERLAGEVAMTEEGLAALFFPTFSTFLGRPGLYLEDLFVLPTRRGLGVGRTLLARLAAIAVERGCGRLEWSVLDWNQDAIRFYDRLDARPHEGWTGYRLEAAPLLRLAGEGHRPGEG